MQKMYFLFVILFAVAFATVNRDIHCIITGKFCANLNLGGDVTHIAPVYSKMADKLQYLAENNCKFLRTQLLLDCIIAHFCGVIW